MIGSREQKEGRAHAARNVICTPDGMELELQDTYEQEAGVLQLKRRFALTPEGLRLTDEGKLRTAEEVTWVFLLRNEPKWEKGSVTAGKLRIRCPEELTFTAEEKPVTDARMARNWPGSLWRGRLKSKKADVFRMTFEFSANDREA